MLRVLAHLFSERAVVNPAIWLVTGPYSASLLKNVRLSETQARRGLAPFYE